MSVKGKKVVRFDMHCHVKEGSPDSKVAIADAVRILHEKGFSGMLVTDHDSYKGYRAWRKEHKDECPEDFVVLRGIEYDTIDAGHFIVIMPSNVKLKILELRGLPVYILMDIVHKHGGILGPAHPFGERYLSIFRTGIYKYHKHITRGFDFVECFNACIAETANEEAVAVAKEYGNAMFGGSDFHKEDCIGMGYTEFPENISIKTEDDLIKYIKCGGETVCGGERYTKTTKDKIGKFNHVLIQGFWVYNKGLGAARRRKRVKELKHMD